MLSVLIPVFRESRHMDGLLSKILSEKGVEREIIVSIDEPTETSRKLMKRYSKKVSFIVNEERVGKAKALNNAICQSKGDILLFLDSDLKVVSNNLLSKVEQEMEGADVLDFKKSIIRSSKIARLVNYEFMASNVLTTLFSKMGKCLGFNGIAFAMRRQSMLDIGGFREDAVVEDLELGIQCYLKGKTYKYSNEIEVSTESKDGWKDWYVQRKRWSAGDGQFFKSHWKDLARASMSHPKEIMVMLFFLCPVIAVSLLFNTVFENFLLITLLGLSLKVSIFFPIFMITGFGFLLFKSLAIFLVTYVVSGVIFYIASKKLGFSYTVHGFTAYYFFYTPVSSVVFFFNFFRALVTSVQVSDWKISK